MKTNQKGLFLLCFSFFITVTLYTPVLAHRDVNQRYQNKSGSTVNDCTKIIKPLVNITEVAHSKFTSYSITYDSQNDRTIIEWEAANEAENVLPDEDAWWFFRWENDNVDGIEVHRAYWTIDGYFEDDAGSPLGVTAVFEDPGDLVHGGADIHLTNKGELEGGIHMEILGVEFPGWSFKVSPQPLFDLAEDAWDALNPFDHNFDLHYGETETYHLDNVPVNSYLLIGFKAYAAGNPNHVTWEIYQFPTWQKDTGIPALSQAGFVIFVLLLVVAGSAVIFFRLRKARAA